jgi:hypothetical protein
MVVGLLTAAVPMLTNNATVLYTFYPPMLADWAFYLGLTLLVIGSWIVGYSMYFTYYAWRKENPDARTLPCTGLHYHDGDVADRHAGRCRGDLVPTAAQRAGAGA